MVKNIGFALIVVLALSGCGKRGDLQKPVADVAQPGDPKAAPAPAKNDSFILDPLIK